MSATITKSARTRGRILDAAAVVFREQGYAHARLSDIADRAGIQTGSLYYHFESREALVAEILHLGIATAWQQVRDAVDALPATSTHVARLDAALRAHTLAVLEISAYASAQARIVGQVPADVRDVHAVELRAYGEYWSGLFEAARAAGQLRDELDLFTTRMLVLGALNWTAEWFDPQRADAATVAAEAAALVLHGIVVGPR